MATTHDSAPMPRETAPTPRFRFGSLEAWRAALFVSLGFGAACADDAEPAVSGAPSRRAVTRLCLLEGCVGETLAALEAAEALASATDPEVRRALESIAHDERRHAEFAFRFLAWALEQGSASSSGRALAAVLDETVAASRSAFGARSAAPDSNDRDLAQLEAHGILSERRRMALRHAALEEVVVPCVRRLLAKAGGQRDVHTERAA